MMSVAGGRGRCIIGGGDRHRLQRYVNSCVFYVVLMSLFIISCYYPNPMECVVVGGGRWTDNWDVERANVTTTTKAVAVAASGDGASSTAANCSYRRQQGLLHCLCKRLPLTKVPQNLNNTLQVLEIVGGDLVTLGKASFDAYRNNMEELKLLDVTHLRSIESGAFDRVTRLRSIYVNNAPALTRIASDVFHLKLPKLDFVRVSTTGLDHAPSIHIQSQEILREINLYGNQLVKLSSFSFNVQCTQLILEDNQLVEVEENTFYGSSFKRLSLRNNPRLSRLHENAFVGLKELTELDLSNTAITTLPTAGLVEVHLKTLLLHSTASLHVFPSVFSFRDLVNVELTYHYHCCAFLYPDIQSPKAAMELQAKRLQCSSSSSRRRKRGFGDIFNGSSDVSVVAQERATTPKIEGTFSATVAVVTNQVIVANCGRLVVNFSKVTCQPVPDAFNPCEDVMGNVGLRVGVWIVVVAAVVGNAAVMIVLMSTRSEMSVSKFLMCNLAFADFCMGLYLLMVAAMDLHTIGHYFNYAIAWQTGAGCQVAGFLSVFSSELSIFTLTVITLERWYAITYAIDLNKRLRLGTAVKVIVIGWLYALIYAALPLLGISGYSKVSICLPFDTSRPLDTAYILSLLVINAMAFVLICACYAKMYWTISAHHSTVTHNDQTVAKRMALLVFTDFACWAPIAFFGVTAVTGYPLINVTNSKILLVFFYPLNSCANPFLYAIFTKQYRRDLMKLLNRYGLAKELRSSANKSNAFNKQMAGSFSVTNVTNNVCLRNRTLGDVVNSGSTLTGNTRRASLATQMSTVVVDKHHQERQNSEEISQLAMTSLDHDDDDDGDPSDAEGDLAEASTPMLEEEQVSPKHKGSPHPIKNNNCAKLAGHHLLSRHQSPLMEMSGAGGGAGEVSRWGECWNGRRSASLGGCVQDIIPLQHQPAIENTCKSAI